MEELVRELQEKYVESQDMEERFNLVGQQINELQEFDFNLNILDKSESKEMLASLGKGVYIPTEIKDKNLYVGVGSGIFVRKKPGEARGVIKGQLSGLLRMRNEISQIIEKLNMEMQNLIVKIEKSQKKVK